MFIRNNKRFNLNAALDEGFIDDAGIQHPGVLLRDPEFREANGITEIPDPEMGDPATQYTQEIDEEPWVIIVDKPQAQIDQAFNASVVQQIVALEASQARAVREAALGNAAPLQKIEDDIAALRASLKVITE